MNFVTLRRRSVEMRIPKRRIAPHGLPFSITPASCSSVIRKDSGLFCSINCCDDLKADAVPLFATFERV
jgi:hypothetical protein